MDDHARLISIRYEDLASYPQETLTEAMNLSGLAPEEQQLDAEVPGRDRGPQHARFSELSKPVDSSSVGRCKTELSSAEIRTCVRIAGRELRAFGYPDR